MIKITAEEYNRAACPVFKCLEELGDQWSMQIIREMFFGYMRFDQLEEKLKISRSVLSSRLKKLNQSGLIYKKEYQETGQRKRYEYRLTQKGLDLHIILSSMIEYGNKHLVDKASDKIKVVDREGNPTRVAVLNASGRELSIRDLKMEFKRQ